MTWGIEFQDSWSFFPVFIWFAVNLISSTNPHLERVFDIEFNKIKTSNGYKYISEGNYTIPANLRDIIVFLIHYAHH